MTPEMLVDLFKKGTKRCYLLGDIDNGVLIGLDLEGRIYTIFNKNVVSRVNSDAILGQTTRNGYINPGGDGLWPAPEGTNKGYFYVNGEWRVPPGLSGATYIVTQEKENFVRIEAEIDLINCLGYGIPTIFSREITLITSANSLQLRVKESIQYLGTKPLTNQNGLITPWSLCQFDSSVDAEVVFPETDLKNFWDLYKNSSHKRTLKNGLWHTRTDGGDRYQIAMNDKIDWIEFRHPLKDLIVKRSINNQSPADHYIDISDASPDVIPSHKGVKFSVYSDPSLFMEIEAAGGCPPSLNSGDIIFVEIDTVFS
jgi:hypothetical protein